MAVVFKPKRSNTGRMESTSYGANTVLGAGEIFFEKQSSGTTYSEGSGTSSSPVKYRYKIGDGSTKYSALGYADNTPVSSSGSGNAVTGISQDTSTGGITVSKGNVGTVTSVTISASSPISIDSSAAITGSGSRTISHANSGATAGSYGDSAAQTPGYGGTFKVPYITVNATGHVTGISEHTVKIPSADDTNTTYSFANGTNSFTVTPSNGTAQTVTVTPNDTTKLPLAGGTLTGNVEFANSSIPLSAGKVTGLRAGTSQIYADGIAISNPNTPNDVGFIRVLGTGESDTVLEIATGDDGGDPSNGGETIAVRQYNTSNQIAKEAKLLDPYGNTTFPGTVTTQSVQVGGTAATMQYNSTNQCVEFVFA